VATLSERVKLDDVGTQIVSRRGLYGQNLADCFHLMRAPSFVSHTLRHSELAVTHIVCNVENNGLTAPIPREDAFLVTLQLRESPAHDLWLDGKAVKTAALSAGTTCIYDLRQSPIVNSISAFANLHFYIPRNALDAAADGGDTSIFDALPHNPGIGIHDPVIRSLGMSLLPAFERPDEVVPIFVDHITGAVAAYVAHMFDDACKATAACSYPRGPAKNGLAQWQEKRAKEMLSARLDGVISIAQVAKECGLPARAFTSAFRESTGELPHQWLLQHRVERAKGLLQSRLSVPEVATACGFVGEEHLTRVFTQVTGVAPGEWVGKTR
jgi:AraC-like DNA-binding protein